MRRRSSVPEWWCVPLALLSLPLLVLLPPMASGVEESFCAALGLTQYYTPRGNTEPDTLIKDGGPMSLGFGQWYEDHLNSFWAANHVREDYCKDPSNLDDLPVMDIYPVSVTLPDGSSSALPGWFHLHVHRKGKGLIKMAAVWSLSEVRESVGEFENVDTTCGGQIESSASTSTGKDKWLPKESVMPCAGTPLFSPKNPSMAVYSNLKSESKKIRDIHLLWKLDQSACDNLRTTGFRFWVAMNPSTFGDLGKDRYSDQLDVGKSHGRIGAGGTPPNKPTHQFGKYGPYVYTTKKITPKFYGAAAPILDPKLLKCTQDKITSSANIPDWIANYNPATASNALELAPSMFNKKNPDGPSPGLPTSDDTQNEALRWRCNTEISDCQYVPKNPWPKENLDLIAKHRQTCKPFEENDGTDQDKNQPRPYKYKPFWGRCQDEMKGSTTQPRVTPDLEKSPTCPHGTKDISSNTEHYGYVTTNLPAELKKEGCDCPTVPDLKDLDEGGDAVDRSQMEEEAKSRMQEEGSKGEPRAEKEEKPSPRKAPESGCRREMSWGELDVLGLCKDSEVGMEAYGARDWHAKTMLAAILMMIPVSCYVARYQKGQLPPADRSGEVVLPLSKWYTFHFYITLFIACMFGSALGAIGIQVVILGYSLNPSAALHRHLGWGIFGTFLLQIFSGLLRPLNLTWRRVVIWLHWGCGLFVYYGGVVLCIMSYNIPSSPFAFQSHLDPEFDDLTYHAPSLIMVMWLVMDLVYHAYSMAYIIRFDRKHNVILGIGKYFPILLPIGPRYYRSCTDQQLKNRERNLRWMAYGYTALCLVTFFVLIIVMDVVPHMEHHGFGPMGCTHDKDGHYNSEDPSITGPEGLCPDI